MVRPTTARPWRTSSAATVELSTPPLMATAMGAVSGMHGDSAQMRHGRLRRASTSASTCSAVLERPSENRMLARARSADRPDGGEHVRGRDGAAGAGRAGGDGEAAQVERDHQGLAIDAVEIDVAGVGRAIPARAVDAGAGNAPRARRSPGGRAARRDARLRPPGCGPPVRPRRRRRRCPERSRCPAGGRARDGRRRSSGARRVPLRT